MYCQTLITTDMKKVYNIHENSDWVDAQGYPEGTKLKVLFDEGGVKTFLLKTPAGFNMAAHSHTHFEQHFPLIEGQAIITRFANFI